MSRLSRLSSTIRMRRGLGREGGGAPGASAGAVIWGSSTVTVVPRPRPGLSASTRPPCISASRRTRVRSEEHTSELQSLAYLVCRLLLEKKKKSDLTLLVIHQQKQTCTT